MKDPRTIVIIPAYNESERIGRVLDGLATALSSAEVVVVDDGSTDSTADAARERGAKVLRLPVNLGYGAALQTGYRYASNRSFDVAVQMDADGQHDPRSVGDLVTELLDGDLDLVIGSRFLGGDPGYDVGSTKRLALWILRRITGAMIHRPISDPTSGFQALSPRLVDFYAAWDGFPVDFPDADVLLWVSRCGFRIGEVPVRMEARAGGRSMHDGLRPVLYALRMGIALPLWGLTPVRSSRPVRSSGRAATRPAHAEDRPGGVRGKEKAEG